VSVHGGVRGGVRGGSGARDPLRPCRNATPATRRNGARAAEGELTWVGGGNVSQDVGLDGPGLWGGGLVPRFGRFAGRLLLLFFICPCRMLYWNGFRDRLEYCYICLCELKVTNRLLTAIQNKKPGWAKSTPSQQSLGCGSRI
jgi:hypothetical protein